MNKQTPHFKCSYFHHVEDRYPKDYSLDDWLKMTIDPPPKLRAKVVNYRRTMDKDVKKSLPLITVSGLFSGLREVGRCVMDLPFICLDIDRYSKKRRSNICIDMDRVKDMFKEHPCTYYVGYSVGGDGIYAIIRLFESGKLRDYFDYFEAKLSKIGINIDGSCKDVTRLRFFSYDPEGYYNPKAKAYKLPVKKEVLKPKATISMKSNEDKVLRVLDIVERNSMDITGCYDDWVRIGGALAGEFGELGRDLFHRFSRFSSQYKHSECDRKYTHCMKMNSIGLGSLFKIAGDYGVRY